MKVSLSHVLCLVAATTAHPTIHPRVGGPPGFENIDTHCPTLECKQNAVAFAFLYGFPLYSYGALSTSAGLGPPTNFLIHQRDLADADEKAVVRPNSDTLYSSIFIDLSANDLIVEVPEFGDRFGVWPFYDLYGNNFANIGNAANVTHGKFLVRYDQDKIGVITDCDDESYDGYIGMPTPYGLGLARVVVTNSTEDLDSAHQLQDQMKATKKPRGGENTAPSLDLNMFNEPAYKPGNGTSFEQAVLRLAATLGPYNEPEVAEDRDWVSRTLRNAGCKDGKWIQPPGTNLTAAVAAANVSVAKLLNQPGNIEQMSNNWIAFEPTIMGNFYSYYQMRYLIASWGYLALTSDQAIYPSLSGIDEIGPNEAILFQFSGRPVLKEEGFWSITAYGADQFFIDNDLNRFTLGDRSEITFPDGTLVYLEGEETEDGPFEILLQPADVQPPDNWTSNWLPAPPGGGSLSFTLRWYGPDDAMAEGSSYEYPKASIIDAIKA